MGLTERDVQDEGSARAPAVVKAARILGELAQHPDAMSASDLARRIDMAKSSVSDLCLALVEEGLLARASDGRYLLGRHLVELARPLVGGTRLLEVFSEACDAVPSADGETITMSIADGSDIVIVAVRRGLVLLPITPKVGLHLPIWTTAAGRALLSATPIEALRHILRIETATAAGVSGSMPSAEKLHAELRRESRLGVHIDREQTAVGLISLGAPLILQADTPPTAAIAISTRASLIEAKRRRALSAAVLHIVEQCTRRSRASDEDGDRSVEQFRRQA
jgi:DNA-binding IclR family transcriptional regulator